MKLSQIAVDVQAEEEGEWRDHPYFEDVQVLVRSHECEAYQRKRRELLNGRQIRRTKLGDTTQDGLELARRLMPVLLRGWRGIDDAEYSEEISTLWASRKKIPEGQPQAGQEYYRAYRRFWDGVNMLAVEVGEGEQEDHVESLGN